MAWKQLEPTPAHLTYLILAAFLVSYALFSSFIRNRLHLSEPPLATLGGIIFGPKVLNILNPHAWGLGDNVVQEFTRLILGIQVFAVGVELPPRYFRTHWSSVLMLLGPVMAAGWLICAALIQLLIGPGWATSLTVAACLTPTDPVLAASVLSNSQFSSRVPPRIRRLLSAESGCNDGVSFPFLYAGLAALTRATFGAAARKWMLITVLWQCVLGTLLGVAVGYAASHVLRFSDARNMVGRPSYFVFYLLLAVLCVGVASVLGVDDFLLAFAAGATFSRDGAFASTTAESSPAAVIDMLLNSTAFVFFGAMIPWDSFRQRWEGAGTPVVLLGPGRLAVLLVLILLLRRLPAVLAFKPLIPHLRTWPEAVFAGHFGPMGVGALFLAIEARAQLETDTSEPLPHPPTHMPDPARQRAVELLWPVICFVVMGSIFVHGLSTLAVSVGISLKRPSEERAPLLGAETEGLDGMEHGDEDD